MSNKRLLLEDAEGNLVESEDAGSFSELPGELGCNSIDIFDIFWEHFWAIF